jgi:hypothetical protein
MQLQVRSQTMVARECPSIARRVRARGRVGSTNVVLE